MRYSQKPANDRRDTSRAALTAPAVPPLTTINGSSCATRPDWPSGAASMRSGVSGLTSPKPVAMS